MERKISSLHLVALAVTALIFAVGLLLGWNIGYTAESQMKTDIGTLQSETYALEVLSMMKDTGEAGCPVLENEFNSLTTMTTDYGQKLEYMEQKLGKLDPNVMSLKSDYSLMQARNYLLLKEADKSCNTSHIIVLYFYTNEGYSTSTDQGIALDDALQGMPALRDKVAIYHFDSNVQNPVVAAFKEQYNVTVLPAMIINGKKYVGYQNADKCREILQGAG